MNRGSPSAVVLEPNLFTRLSPAPLSIRSNMQFTVGCSGDIAIARGDPGFPGYDAPAEIAASDGYPLIRTMTVGETTTSYSPLSQLGAPPTLPWSVANSSSIGLGNWSATSAVCWYYGKNLFDATGVPQGLVSSNWGGTIIQVRQRRVLCDGSSSCPLHSPSPTTPAPHHSRGLIMQPTPRAVSLRSRMWSRRSLGSTDLRHSAQQQARIRIPASASSSTR